MQTETTSIRLSKSDRKMLRILARRFRLRSMGETVRVAIASCYGALLQNEKGGWK